MKHVKITSILSAIAISMLAAPAFAGPGISGELVAQASINVNIEVGTKKSSRPARSSKTTRTTRTTHSSGNSGANRRSQSNSKTTRTTTTTTTTTTNRNRSSRGHAPNRGNPLTNGHRQRKSGAKKHVVVHEHVVVHQHPETGAQIYPMDDVQFNNLLIQIENEPFSSGKISVLQMATDYHYFTSEQTAHVVSSLTFSNDQVDAAVMMYPRVVDPDYFYTVMSVFTFQSSKDEVRARLGI